MKHLDDKRRMFFDMQEHPENYSDEQLEAMMAELDREPDTEAAWERQTAPHNSPNGERKKTIPWEDFRRIAAVFLAAAFLGVLTLAGYRAFSGWQGSGRGNEPEDTSMVNGPSSIIKSHMPDTIFRFKDIRLDSILTIVGRHYGSKVVFRENAPRTLRLYATWNSGESLADFVEMMNEFDGLRLEAVNDTLFVETNGTKEGTR